MVGGVELLRLAVCYRRLCNACLEPALWLTGVANGDGEFNCDMCGYTARNWSKMKEHMIRHSEGTPFACSYCDSKYKRPADLNRHLKIKHNTCLADIGLDGPTLKGVMGPAFADASAAAGKTQHCYLSLRREGQIFTCCCASAWCFSCACLPLLLVSD